MPNCFPARDYTHTRNYYHYSNYDYEDECFLCHDSIVSWKLVYNSGQGFF